MKIEISNELLLKYDRAGPRYTSYPTAPVWTQNFGAEDHADSLQRAGASSDPISMYLHLPFCKSMCWYCGCNVSITQNREKMTRYVDRVIEEAALARRVMGRSRPVIQHHWGGGTPTHLPPEEMQRLFQGLHEIYPVTSDAEISIEIDPRVTTVAHLETLRRCGFNRISMGIQDFDPLVQKSINRIQSFEETRELAEAAIALGFQSLNFDLVYGLPRQNPKGFGETLQHILEMKPGRVACYSYAHVPWIKRHQKVINADDLPTGQEKMNLYLQALNSLQAAGYEAIGMDHFAQPDDSLVRAAKQGELHRNFMGYTTRPAEEMLSFGVTSISEIAGAFAQNLRSLTEWHDSVAAGRLPVDRGLRRSEDDDRRRRIILDLMCGFRLDFAAHGGKENFEQQYAHAMNSLAELVEDGLLQISDSAIHVTDSGRLFLRNICMPFDAYLEDQMSAGRPLFSKTV